MSQPPSMPRNFLDEIETALREARESLDASRERIAALDELHTISLRLSFELDRPVTVFDVVRSARDDEDRARRRRLVHTLRAV
jgi:hypothetical protein